MYNHSYINKFLPSYRVNSDTRYTYQGVGYDLLATQVAYQTQNIQGARYAIPACQAQINNQVSQGAGYVIQAAAAYLAQTNTAIPQTPYTVQVNAPTTQGVQPISQVAYHPFLFASQAFLTPAFTQTSPIVLESNVRNKSTSPNNKNVTHVRN